MKLQTVTAIEIDSYYRKNAFVGKNPTYPKNLN